MAHVGRPIGEAVPAADVTWGDIFAVYDSNADIATAAGYGAPGQHRQGTQAWKDRRTFMRNVQRYRQESEGGPGQRRTPTRLEPRIRRLARRGTTRAATVRDVIRLMGMQGTTSDHLEVNFRYSPRDRMITASVYTHQSVYRGVGWRMRGFLPRDADEWETLGERYLEAFMVAYGMPSEVAQLGTEGTPGISFTIGREEPIDYDYH